MRPYAGMAWALGALLVVGCGGDGDGNGGPENQAPTASFEAPVCDQLTCTFTDASTDSDGTIASRSWTFESGTPATSTEASPVVTFPAAGTYTVTLTVTDNEGGTDDFSQDVTVTDGAPVNQPPTASFDVECTGLACTFTSTSSDPDGTIASYAWDFGEAGSSTNTSTEQNPTHTYVATTVTDYTVTLTVTDDDGATATATEAITVTPPASLQCDEGGSEAVSCTLDLTSRATLTITLTSRDCELGGNRFRITSPVQQTIFTNGCSQPVGTVYTITGPNPDGSFDAGSQIQAEFTQGAGSPDDPPRQPPAILVEGEFPTWTISIDDGGDAAAPRDFDDLVLTAQATTVP